MVAKAKPKAKAGKPKAKASATVLKFPKTKGKSKAKDAVVKAPAGTTRRNRGVPFMPLGASTFGIMMTDKGIDGVVPNNVRIFNGLRGCVEVRWPLENGHPSFVPDIRAIIRRGTVPIVADMLPADAATIAAGLAVALAECEIQAPANIAVSGNGNEWQQVVALMRRLKMIDADMDPELADVP